jgi:DNA mismatch repair ATPase MutS
MKKKKIIDTLKASFGQVKDDDFRFDLITKYFSNKDNAKAFQVLSDKTCNDLDFEELFMFLDRTTSKVGQQCLYNTLRAIPSTENNIEEKEKLIEKLTNDTNLRLAIQKQLVKLNKTEVYYIASLFQDEHQKPPQWFIIVRLLSFTSVFSLLMLPFNPKMFFVFLGVFVVNIAIHYLNKKNLYAYLGSIPQLLRLNSVAGNLHKDPLLKNIEPQLQSSIHILKKVRNRMSFFRLEANLQSEAEAIFWGMLELLKVAFLLEPLLLFGILKQLNTKREAIENVFRFVGQIDILVSIASLRRGLENYCLPAISDSSLSAKNVYHPLIPNCVANSIDLSGKSVLLTGSNMSGKTSFIRTIGLNTITGLTLNTCFAESMEIPKLRIYSAIRISDDLMNDKSYYFEEVLTIKEMIEKSTDGKPNLFLLDEIFKGTNTIERISAGKAVLSTLAQNNNIVFVATHDIELTDMLNKEYELYHFSEIVKNNTVDFDYTLKEGKLKNRNAIRILQINHYPSALIEEAITIAQKLDNSISITKSAPIKE